MHPRHTRPIGRRVTLREWQLLPPYTRAPYQSARYLKRVAATPAVYPRPLSIGVLPSESGSYSRRLPALGPRRDGQGTRAPIGRRLVLP